MKNSTVVKLVVLGMLVAGLSARPANAQVFKGNFTLPKATRWGLATLPAGDYSFALDHDYGASMITVFQGAQAVARIQTVSVSDMKAGRSEMVMEGGKIREVKLPQLGVTLEYFRAHNPGHRADSQSPVAQIIPVTMMGAGR
jgi:hypothetical protein